MPRSVKRRQLHRATIRIATAFAIGLIGVIVTPPTASAQGTGGTAGTTTTTLSNSDVFLGVQKVINVNLNDLDRALFLNGASCRCQRETWIKAVLTPAAVARSSTIPSTNRVTMYLGNMCDQSVFTPSCNLLKDVAFSEFRLSGMLVDTRVDVLAHAYGATQTGGTGTGGVGGQSGTDGSGGTTGNPDDPNVFCGNLNDGFTQTLWLFIGANPGAHENGVASMPLVIDAVPPPAPANVTLAEANEALLVSWTAVDKTMTSDLQGYQIFCTRADQYQVFTNGTFRTSIDTCGGTLDDNSPTAIADRNTHFLCSDFLSISQTSYRLKILQNGIPYGVGVAAVDLHGNASPMTPIYDSPVATLDFYHQYRAGDPQGAATGGACSVTPGAPGGGELGASLAFGGLAFVLALASRRNGLRQRA